MKKNTLTIGILNLNSLEHLRDQLKMLEIIFKILPLPYLKRINVFVSDNYSNDESKTFLKSTKEKYSWLNFFIHPKRVLYDENVLTVYNKSSSDYVWLLAVDDYIANSNLIVEIIDLLDKYNPSGINFKTTDNKNNSSPNIKKQNIYHFKNCKVKPNILVLGGKISSNILRKNKFYKTSNLHDFVGVGYMHITLQAWLVLEMPNSKFLRIDEKLIVSKQKWGDMNNYHPKFACQVFEAIAFDELIKKYPKIFDDKLFSGIEKFKFIINQIRFRSIHCWNKDMMVEFIHNAFFGLFQNYFNLKKLLFSLVALLLLISKPNLFKIAFKAIFSSHKMTDAPIERV